MVLLKIFTCLCLVSWASCDSPMPSPWLGEMLAEGQRTLIECRQRTSAFERLDDSFVNSVTRLKKCLRSTFLDSLDDLVSSKEISINEYISLVTYNRSADPIAARSDTNDDLLTSVINKMYDVLDTHTIKLNLSPSGDSEENGVFEGRQRRIRRRFRRAFPMVVAGFFIMAAILIPPGFQFMSIVVGKAFLIAKIAFMMAVAGHYRGVMADLNFHHHELLHQGQPHTSGFSGIPSAGLRPGELPGGFGLPSALLGSGVGASPAAGLTQAFGLQSSPFGLGNSILPLRRS